MTDAREVLELMKEVAKSRIDMLANDITLHPPDKKAYYLKEYEDKLRDIERLIRRLNMKLVHSRNESPDLNHPA